MGLKKLMGWYAGLLGLSFLSTTASAQGIFWKAEKNDQVIYLCGSVHVARPDFYPLPDWSYEALKNSDVLILEVANLSDNSNKQVFKQMSQLPEGQEIYDQMDDETIKLATDLGNEYGIPLEFFRYQQPWSFVTSLTMAQIIKLGYQPQSGVDLHFSNKAREYGIPIDGFETAMEQFRMLQSVYSMDNAAYVKESLLELKDIPMQMDTLEQTWLDSDADHLAELMSQSFGGSSEVEEIMLLNRNQHWMEQLSGKFKHLKQIFIVVGAGHIVGEGSLTELLKQAGFSIEQLK
ncbi:TraB/GumN family protein [Gynuella sp.]|uniref:TraB/GumN family protein n=1 Tax=Gynuella sp. TaxID=2969146 RepID=UPI003D15209F